jgi:flavin-dependent dehydrogenase
MGTSASDGAPEFDVAIIGGGPAGSTLGSLLLKYAPHLRVVILERERFPRDHIGESQLPPISDVLDEMGCWDKVEAANFPIKVGATFRWGAQQEIWDFEFLPLSEFKDEPRPARYEGQRRRTAFQVDRAIYDDILLTHAAELGCDVRQETPVARILTEDDRVTGLQLKSGDVITARHYVDASGHVGVMRRALGVEVDLPTKLQNIAVWDYWENAEWAVEIGVGGTRIQVMSVPNGWLWFIPLGPTRTSLGFVCPAEHYKQSGKAPAELYRDAISQSERISALIRNATPSGDVRTTKDWSFCSERTFGENWFLVGESAGFADPILSAGMTLAHTGARELAFTILELDRGEHDPAWLRTHYDENQRKRVYQHIRFADYWYASNSLFTDLKEHCRQIARDAGLSLTPEGAWTWLARGGFANDVIGQAGIGGYDLSAMKQLTGIFTQKNVKWKAGEINILKMNLKNASVEDVPVYVGGRIEKATSYARGGHRLVVTGMYGLLHDMIQADSSIATIYENLQRRFSSTFSRDHIAVALQHAMNCLEVMISEGWVTGKLNPKRPLLQLESPQKGKLIHDNRDEEIKASRRR